MKKINFDMSFLDETSNSKNFNKSRQSSTPSIDRSIVKWILIIVFIISVIAWNMYEDWKMEKINSLTQLALQYKETKNPSLSNVIKELSSLNHQNINITTKHIDDIFDKKRKQYIQALVKTNIEDDIIDENLFSKCLEIYFDGNEEAFNEAYVAEFFRQKASTIKELLSIWEDDPSAFVRVKDKYIKSLFNGNVEEFNEALDQALGFKNFTLVEQELPKNGIITNYTGKKAIAPFRIITSKYSSPTVDNYYIKLIDAKSEQLAVTIFVQSGSTIEVNVPIGTYKIRYAVGEKWYGEKELFGHFTSYNKSEELLDFIDKGYYVQGHSLVLYKVANGNFSTQPMNAKDF